MHPWLVPTTEFLELRGAKAPSNKSSPNIKKKKKKIINQELQFLLQKGAIDHVPLPKKDSGLYSQSFIVPKTDGGLHPFFDLRGLNHILWTYSFKMLTLQLRPSVSSAGTDLSP